MTAGSSKQCPVPPAQAGSLAKAAPHGMAGSFVNRIGRSSVGEVLRQVDRGLAARLLVLMAISASTEGIGLTLVVPVLGLLGGGHAPAPFAAALARIGLVPSLLPLLAIFCGLVWLRALINMERDVATQRMAMQIVDRLRARAWTAVLHCDWRELARMRQTDNVGLLISNVDRVGEAVGQILSVCALLATLAALSIAILAISPGLAAAAILAGALVLTAYRGMRRRAMDLGEQMDGAQREIHGQLFEAFAAVRVIKSLGLEQETVREGLAAFAGLRGAQLAYVGSVGWGQVLLQGCGAIVLAAGIAIAVEGWGASAAQIVPMVVLFARGLPLLGGVQDGWQSWQHARPAVDAALALIARAEAGREEVVPDIVPPRLRREIALDAATVRYPDQEPAALDRVSLVVPAGGIVALMGASGAGKSTVADLLGGLLAPHSGAVRVDGKALEGGLRQAWRQRVAYVQQEAILLKGSIRDNLLRANPGADEARIRTALSLASADFVHDLPAGVDTLIGDGARLLSGGERQRIALARALMRDPALLILDESTSAIDEASEAAVARAVAGLRGKLAILIIAHRGMLTDLADQIVVLDRGAVIASNRRGAALIEGVDR